MARKNTRTVQYFSIAVIIIIAAGLGGWYMFLRGETKTISETSSGRGFSAGIPSFLGGGGSTERNFSTNAGEGSSEIKKGGGPAPRLWHVSETPVAGMGIFGSGASTTVEYVDRATGHVLGANPSTGAVQRMSNTLMPKIQEAIFASSTRIILRYVNDSGDITSFSGGISGEADSVLSGRALPQNIVAIATSPDGASVFYLTRTSSGVVGATAQLDGSKAKTIFSSPLSQWRVSWPDKNNIILAQNASDDVGGSAFSLQTSGTIKPLVENVPGLTATELNGSLIIGQSSGGSLALFARSSGAITSIATSLNTSADKCAYVPSERESAYCAVPHVAPKGQFLNGWYRGAVHTSDAMWHLNTKTGAIAMVYYPEDDNGTPIDIKDVSVSNDGSYVAFRDARDDSLWVMRVRP